jgi:hypothetical protein
MRRRCEPHAAVVADGNVARTAMYTVGAVAAKAGGGDSDESP